VATAEAGAVTGRAQPPRGLRTHVIRGAVVNGGVLALVDAVVLAQGLIVTRLLGPEAIGLYGVVTVTAMTILSLKRVGIDEAFVVQEAADQETEFQHAFTLELVLSAGFALVLLAAAPIVAAVYDDDRLLALTAATAYLPIAFAFQSPTWVFFRRMDYARQRLLQAVVPLVTFAVTVPLAAAGVGVWSLVIGPAVGNLAGIVAALLASPYGLRLRYDRAVARRYLRFSGPVFVALVAALVVAQGQILAFDVARGLEWVGFVTLAATLSRYVDRADVVVVATIYPAICAIRDRTRALEELFVRSNRATLLWVLPVCAGVVLFADDLVTDVLGDAWRPARPLVQGLAVATAMGQLGFNWFSFYRAHERTRPPAVEAVVAAVAFLALAVPGLAVAGVTGFLVGRCAAVAIQLGVRARYVHALLPAVRVRDLLGRSLIPTAAGAAAVVALRAALWGSERPHARAIAELALFCAVVVALSVRLERDLLGELVRAFRRAGAAEQQPGEGDDDERDGGHLPVPVQAGVQGAGQRGGGGPGGEGAVGA
jgi:O-antigen/teichoic acid export membrane protein